MKKVKIQYIGTNVGKIFLSDINDTNFDRPFLRHGNFIVLEKTREVDLSLKLGVLKYFSEKSSSIIFGFGDGAPLLITEIEDEKGGDCVALKGAVERGGVKYTVCCNKKIDIELMKRIMESIRNIIYEEDK